MPKVFVHGNPECSAVWDLLVAELADRSVDDVVRLSPPGFGAPVPDGFEATMAGYHAWLVAELEAIDGPIDLVGHDWGTGHVAGIAADRPDLIRSFAMDCGGLVHPDYVWHDMAQAWQTPEVGEQVVAAMTGASRADRLAMFEGLGMPGSIAEAHADAVDEAMGACVLTLYRSAVPPALPELGARLRAAVRRPALFVIAEQDPYVPADLAVSTAGDLGGTVVRFADQGHWWMIGNPAAAASALVDFWSSLG
ncbi:MAG TPA: alpha/beta hydrolase [Acidimicrobiaceae bacterium]|nr:alpha/beta hydrolase [Acidimicrobiaceae bacterium]|tara:strand:- start:827 stop:1579 length:753 start_codon:yes stop_codon:yes gene_type:complete